MARIVVIVAIEGMSGGLLSQEAVTNEGFAEATTTEGNSGDSDFPGGASLRLDSQNRAKPNTSKYPLDDPFFPGLLLNDESDGMAPGFQLGDTSLLDLPEEGGETSEAGGPDGAGSVPAMTSPEEEMDSAKSRNLRLGRPQTLVLPAGRSVRRTAINQARSTGDTILANLGALRGSLASPFMPVPQLKVPALRLGILDISPRATAGLVAGHYSGDDGDQIGGFFQAQIAAALREGRYLSGEFDYTIGISTPTGRGRNSRGNGNDIQVDQYLGLEAEFWLPQMPKARFGFELDYTGLSGIERETGTNVSRTLATGTFLATYAYSKKTSIDWDLSVPVRQFSGGVSSGGLTTTIFVNNQITYKTQVGLGLSLGTLRIEGGSSQYFEQLLFRVGYEPSDLWSFDATGGIEFREGGDSFDVNPIFGMGIGWKPRQGTSVTLAAESRVFNSATLVNSDYRSTSVTLTVTQRLGFRLSTWLTLGYENAAYERASLFDQRKRIDNLFEATLGFQVPVNRRWSWELILSAGKNESNVVPFEFIQGVLQTSYRF